MPDELRGRVMSLNVLLFLGSTPVGGLMIGILSNALSVQVALLVCAALCLAGVSSSENVRSVFNKLLAWGLSMTVVGAIICYVFF